MVRNDDDLARGEEPDRLASLGALVGARGTDPDPQSPFATQRDTSLSLEGARVLCRVQAGLFGADPEPVRIDRFVIVRRIGAGAMGEVFLAVDPEPDVLPHRRELSNPWVMGKDGKMWLGAWAEQAPKFLRK